MTSVLVGTELGLHFGRPEVWSGRESYNHPIPEFYLYARDGKIVLLANNRMGTKLHLPYSFSYPVVGGVNKHNFVEGPRPISAEDYPSTFTRDFDRVSYEVIDAVDVAVREGKLNPSESQVIRDMVHEIEQGTFGRVVEDRQLTSVTSPNISSIAAGQVTQRSLRQSAHSLASRFGHRRDR